MPRIAFTAVPARAFSQPAMNGLRTAVDAVRGT